MKQKNTLSLLLGGIFFLGSVFMAHADVLTPEQALSRIGSSSRFNVKSANTENRPVLVYTESYDSEPAVYLFRLNDNGSFLALSADDVAPAVLGYGDSESGTEINPTLKWWLSEYARQISWARNTGAPKAPDAVSQTSFSPIAPMTTTKWNQDAPFNDDCPEIGGTRCVTGCVATALSQVMKYHNWPEKGTGSNSYTASSVGKTLSVNFGDTSYDWSDMLNVYTSSATPTQKGAVANLMYSAGVAVNMDYTTDESSATSFAAAQAMINYFGYDKGIVFYSRDYYTISDWNELVYNQLKNYGPVQYSGQSNEGGHSFVCDGYDTDGYFHINWGWGGMSDGYFLLTALNPTSQGIGGSTSGYNFEQDIIGNVKPSDGTTSTVQTNFVAQQFTPSQSSVSLGSRAYFTGPFYSFSLAEVSGKLGLKLVSSDGVSTYVEGSSFSDMKPEYGVDGYYVTLPQSLAEGTYSVYPAVQDADNNWYEIPVLVGASQVKSVTVSNGTATFGEETSASLAVSDVALNTAFYIGANYEVTATLTNNGDSEYLGGIRLMLVNSDSQAVAEGDEYPVDLEASQSVDITYVSGWTAASNTTLSAGSYYVCFVDENGNQLSDMQSITLNAQAAPTLVVSDFTIEGGTTNVSSDNIVFTGTISCSEGYFGNSLSIVIFPYTTGNVTSVASYSTDPIFLSAGQSQSFSVKADFNTGEAGSKYFAMIYEGSSPVSDDQLVFSLGLAAAIDDIDTSATVVETDYYTIDGVRLSSNVVPDKGLYVKVMKMSDGTVSSQKMIVR